MLTADNQEYDDLICSVCDWARKIMAPFIEGDPAAISHFEESLRSRSPAALHIQGHLNQDLEHSWASHWPEMEEDIIASMIIMFLDRSIFQTVLCGKCTKYTNAIRVMEESMQTHMQPARGKSRMTLA